MEHKKLFVVIEAATGREVSADEIGKREPYRNDLCWTDIEGFFLDEYGYLFLADECGNYVGLDESLFRPMLVLHLERKAEGA